MAIADFAGRTGETGDRCECAVDIAQVKAETEFFGDFGRVTARNGDFIAFEGPQRRRIRPGDDKLAEIEICYAPRNRAADAFDRVAVREEIVEQIRLLKCGQPVRVGEADLLSGLKRKCGRIPENCRGVV